ncbi:hypothetical protein [Pseudomonas amygdali]|uniref:Uncharacterized protein n=2 Tax=Pseudomonas amygdali pv. lachrymans TaxID=53707 RepID=A0ABR5KRE2_PSEAV|nr:hypothetical protein [Pseudomonas amygdali]AXH59959.1 hypothetical protein PLA107_032555 [Pseudomonas amygdali pv. lachrymans str. M301315]KPC17362.1 Uncharacterized protein AC499_0564 [Pseudomonas amygdali pv. lachrymans]RMT05892.1 hypothetical protein ALP54_03820 [Pseudomonas amygdali pv. lachrymans]
MTLASQENDSILLSPGETYGERSEDAKSAEKLVRLSLRNQKIALVESFVTWLALLWLAVMTQETLAALSSAAWLAFVGWYYLPGAGKDLMRSREHLRIRAAYLTVEDAERFLKEEKGYPMIEEIICYRKQLTPCFD